MSLDDWLLLAILILLLSNIFDTIKIDKLKKRIKHLEQKEGTDYGRSKD